MVEEGETVVDVFYVMQILWFEVCKITWHDFLILYLLKQTHIIIIISPVWLHQYSCIDNIVDVILFRDLHAGPPTNTSILLQPSSHGVTPKGNIDYKTYWSSLGFFSFFFLLLLESHYLLLFTQNDWDSGTAPCGPLWLFHTKPIQKFSFEPWYKKQQK